MKTPPWLRRRWGWLAAAAVVAAFLFAAGRGLDAPGLEYDEAFDTTLGMRVVQGLPMGPSDWWLTVHGRRYPLKTEHPYDFSAFTIWYSALAFKLGGVSAVTLRRASLALAALLLLAFYGFSRRWFSEGTALAACALAAAHPSFLLASRAGFFFIELFVALPELAALWLLSVWHQERRPWALYAGCFLWAFGLNVSTKALAFVVAAPLVYAVWARRTEWPSRRQAAGAAAAAGLGALNPLAYTLAGGKIFPHLAAAILAPTRAGVDNRALLHNLGTRLGQLADLLAGSAGGAFVGPMTASDRLTPVVFAAAWAAIAAAAAARPSRERRLGALASLVAALLVTTCLTPAGLSPQHVLVLWPLPMLVIAAAWERFAPGRGAGSDRSKLALAAAAVLCLFVSEARVGAAALAQLRETGGVEYWSDAVAPLARYLDERGIREPVSVQPGSALNVSLLTQGRVAPIKGYVDAGDTVDDVGADPGDDDRMASLMKEPGRRFILFGEGVDVRRTRGLALAFRLAAREAGMRLRLERTFRDRLDRPVYRVYAAVPEDSEPPLAAR